MVYSFAARTLYSDLFPEHAFDPRIDDQGQTALHELRATHFFARYGSGPLYGRDDGRSAAPVSIRWNSSIQDVPDLFVCGGVNVVSDTLRAVIETHEPRVHQFLPVDVLAHQFGPAERRWWLIVCNEIPSVERNLTSHHLTSTGRWLPVRRGRFVFSKSAIGAAGLWRDSGIPGSCLCSNALGHALAAARLSGLSLIPYPEI